MLLLFQFGTDRYAMEARHAVEVIPLVLLQKIPGAPRGVAGLLNYRGRPVPVLDLCELTVGRPARERMNTRIIVGKFAESTGKERWAGLIAEQVTSLSRSDSEELLDSGLNAAGVSFSGKVTLGSWGIIQLLHPETLVTNSLKELGELGLAIETLKT